MTFDFQLHEHSHKFCDRYNSFILIKSLKFTKTLGFNFRDLIKLDLKSSFVKDCGING